MSKYKITYYTRLKAKALGVTVRPSFVKGKKIDVFRNGKKVASIGAIGYGDFPTFLKLKGIEYAEKRQKAYKMRHEKDRHKIGSPGYYADQLLW
jgi:hypothetical protein